MVYPWSVLVSAEPSKVAEVEVGPGLWLTPEQRDTLRSHALKADPEECCGVLLGRRQGAVGQLEEIVASSNAAPAEQRRNRFHIAPGWLAATQRSARQRGLEVLGYYHSHPAGTPRPSAHDIAHALDGVSTLIIGQVPGKGVELRSWRWSRRRHRFEPEILYLRPPDGGRTTR